MFTVQVQAFIVQMFMFTVRNATFTYQQTKNHAYCFGSKTVNVVPLPNVLET